MDKEDLLHICHYNDRGTGIVVYADMQPILTEQGAFVLKFLGSSGSFHLKEARMRFSGSRLSVDMLDVEEGHTLVEYVGGKLVAALRVSQNIIGRPTGSVEFCHSMLEAVLNGGDVVPPLETKMEKTLERISTEEPTIFIEAAVKQIKPHYKQPYSGRIADYFPALSQNHNV